MHQGQGRRSGRGRWKSNLFLFAPVALTIAAVVGGNFVLGQSAPKAATPASDLNQLMRSLFFPHSNVFFSAQRYDPATVKRASEPSASSDPLTGVFGGWEAVENSALTLADASDLLLTPGRKCSNGRDVPLNNADWAPLVNGLREASMVAYKAALTKDQN